MEFLAMLYTVLLVAICLMMALLLFRSGRPTGGLDEADCEELKDWLEEQLAAQAREFNARQDAIAQQNYAAIRSVSETLQTAVQSMSTTLGQGQDSQQRILERRLQSLEQANNQQMEQLRRAMGAGDARGPEAKRLVAMHAAWLRMYWPEGLYSPGAHRSLADGYLADERFRGYYEAVAPGAAQFLRDAVHAWA